MLRSYKGSCHCGRVRFALTADIDHVRVCNCSICRRRGALMVRVPEEDLAIETPLSELTLYEWGTRTAKDYFCPVCGILPFRRPSAPTEKERAESVAPFEGWAVNARCLEDFDPTSVPVVTIHGSAI